MTNKILRLLSLAAAILAATTTDAATWTEIDAGLPAAPVGVYSLAISPKQPSTIYARTVSPDGVLGGLFRSTDGAQSWQSISSIVGVNNLILDPQSAGTLYVVSARGLLKSTDSGATWTTAGAGLPNTYFPSLAIDPTSSSKLYAAVGGPSGGIYKSSDGAATWTVLNTGLPANSFVSSIVVDPTNGSVIYAIASIPMNNGPSTPVLLKSSDEGQSWTQINSPDLANSNVLSLVLSSSSPSIIYATTLPAFGGPPSGTRILKSVDGGSSWTSINTGLPYGVEVTGIIVDPTNSSTLYLGVTFGFAEAGGILKSTDAGANWTTIKPDFPANTPIQTLALDPVNPSTLYATGEGVLYKSTNGGVNWNKSVSGLAAITVGAITVSPVDAATIYAGAGNALFKSYDGGVSWNSLHSFQLFNPTSAAVASPFPDGSPAYPGAILINAASADTLYLATSRGNGCYYADNLLFKSVDGGATWDNSISPDRSGCILNSGFGPSAGLKALDATDPNTLYVAEADDGDGYWGLLRSRDGGGTWTSFPNFPGDLQAGVWTLVIDPTSPNTLYAGLDDTPIYDDTVTPGQGGIFKSTDGGATWASIGLSGAAVNLLTLDPANPTVLYAVTEGHYGTPLGFRGVFKSVDAGATWSAVNNGLARLADSGARVTSISIDPANTQILYLGVSGSGVYRTGDGGANWSPLNAGLSNLDVRGLAVGPGAGHTLYAGTANGIFKLVDDGR
jgi:photosystem II stability/assembly factor-like uncharacterized protein